MIHWYDQQGLGQTGGYGGIPDIARRVGQATDRHHVRCGMWGTRFGNSTAYIINAERVSIQFQRRQTPGPSATVDR
jgi:hypothetical protein